MIVAQIHRVTLTMTSLPNRIIQTIGLTEFVHCVALCQILEHHVILLGFGPSILSVDVHLWVMLWRPVCLTWEYHVLRGWWRWVDIVELSLGRGLFISVGPLRRWSKRGSTRVVKLTVVLSNELIAFVSISRDVPSLHLWPRHTAAISILVMILSSILGISCIRLINHRVHNVAHLWRAHILVLKNRLILSLLYRLVHRQLLPLRLILNILNLLPVAHLNRIVFIVLKILWIRLYVLLYLDVVIEHIGVQLFKLFDLLLHRFSRVVNSYLRSLHLLRRILFLRIIDVINILWLMLLLIIYEINFMLLNFWKHISVNLIFFNLFVWVDWLRSLNFFLSLRKRLF